jgi:hypothetical protein
VNGTGPDIQVVKPFRDAIELTKQILFRPFDLKKWFIIGFAAWLAHIGGGFSFNTNFNYKGRSDLHDIPGVQAVSDAIHRTPTGLLIVLVTFLVLFILALIVLLAWLRARGRFMFTDCVVRNRAAIAEPWREFRRLGNSFFLFSLAVALGFLLLAALFVLPLILVMARGHHHHNTLLVCIILLWAVFVFVLAIAWALIAHLMIPIMYRRKCMASEAFRASVSLINRHPETITLYCLFWIVVGVGSAIAACAVVCLTCCVAAVPYLGTVILLPIYVCLRAFGLLFLKQFGSDYDVWAGLPPGPDISVPPPPLPTI